MTDERPVAVARGRLCSEAAGFNVHAGVRVAASDRKGLERLCRYLARGPIAEERLREMPDGRILLRLRKPLRDGSTHLAFEPLEFIEKLLPLIPAPRVHQTRFHGLLACAARQRKKVVPVAPREADADCDGAVSDDASRRRRASWAALLARVFCLDILSCPRCGSRMKIVAAIRDPWAPTARAQLVAVGMACAASSSTWACPPSPRCRTRPARRQPAAPTTTAAPTPTLTWPPPTRPPIDRAATTRSSDLDSSPARDPLPR